MDERAVSINIGGKDYELILTTRATKAIASRYGGLEDLGEKLMKSENFEQALDEVVWLIVTLANQSVQIFNLRNKGSEKPLLTAEEVELLTIPTDLATYNGEQCRKIGTFTITFSCYPFRYSLEGQRKIDSTNAITLINPYPFNAKPYIKVNGRGEGRLIIQSEGSNKIWTFKTLNGYTEADSEQMNFYHDTQSKNDTVSGDGFPILYPGRNVVAFEGAITSIEIIPRWVCL